MALSDEKIREFMKRLLMSRMRILCNHGFFGLLLMHMIYTIDESVETAYTDGERIAFSPDFLDELSDSELDFVLMHEILHMVLQHCMRSGEEDSERYNIAADIVINSIIMDENGGDPRSITLSNYGESMHKAPDGKEGNLYTTEEVFGMLPPTPQGKQANAAAREKEVRIKAEAVKTQLGKTAERNRNRQNRKPASTHPALGTTTRTGEKPRKTAFCGTCG